MIIERGMSVRTSSSLAELEALEQLVADARIELTKQSIQTPPVTCALAKLNQVRVRLLSLSVALEHTLPANSNTNGR